MNLVPAGLCHRIKATWPKISLLFYLFILLNWDGSCYVDQAGLEPVGDHPASVSQVLGLQVRTIIHSCQQHCEFWGPGRLGDGNYGLKTTFFFVGCLLNVYI
ncbi:linker for activation of T cells, isoform CRA_c, partial [Rattus norvegicus]